MILVSINSLQTYWKFWEHFRNNNHNFKACYEFWCNHKYQKSRVLYINFNITAIMPIYLHVLMWNGINMVETLRFKLEKIQKSLKPPWICKHFIQWRSQQGLGPCSRLWYVSYGRIELIKNDQKSFDKFRTLDPSTLL